MLPNIIFTESLSLYFIKSDVKKQKRQEEVHWVSPQQLRFPGDCSEEQLAALEKFRPIVKNLNKGGID